MRQGGTFCCCCNNQCWFKCSGSLYRKQHVCLRHKRFTDNDRDQQTYGSDPKKIPEMDTIFSPQCKNDQCGSKNTHAAVPEKLTINFFWPNGPIYMKSFQLNKMT